MKLKHKKKFTRPIPYDMHEIKEEFNIETKNRFEALLEDIEEKKPDEIAKEAKQQKNTLAKDVSKSSHG